MIRIENSAQVNQPRERVFEALMDVTNYPKWQKGVVQSKPVSDGPVAVGYQFEETAKVGPWTMHTVCTVTDLKRNERYAFTAVSSGPVNYEGAYDLQPVMGGTRLTLRGTARLKGVWRLMEPIFGSDLRKEAREELAAIKRMLEQSADASASTASPPDQA